MATARKTAAQKAVEKANEAVLADYYRVNDQKREIDREHRRLKKAVELIPDGQVGSYIKTYGNPRVITDQDAVAERYAELGEEVPKKLAHPLIVRKV